MNTRLQQILEFLEEDPTDGFLRYALALEYSKEGDLDRAGNLLLQLIEQESSYVPSYYQMGKIYEAKNEREKAQAIYLKGISVSKNDANQKMHLELKEAYQLLLEDL
jgi:Tfp pilus assembly protein PilF